MNDWIHCNKCSQKYNPTVKIFLTECAHLFCERCTKNPVMGNTNCVICEKPTKAIAISKDMDPAVQPFFIPLEIHLKKVFEIYNFQMQHKTRLYQTFSQKYSFAKRECISTMNKNKLLLKENKMLKAMLMEQNNSNQQHFQTSTPIIKSDLSLRGNNTSLMSSIGFTPSTRTGVGISSRPGFPHRILPSENRNFRPSHFSHHFGSGGSSLQRPSPAQMERKLTIAPIHHRPLGGVFPMEDSRRTGKRT